jgi:hypothetical protein
MTDQRGLAFDCASDLYQQARPEYPEQLYEAMIAAAGLGADDRLLEIGCASGKATLPLARFPEVEVVQSTFEDIDPSAAALVGAHPVVERRSLQDGLHEKTCTNADCSRCRASIEVSACSRSGPAR